MWNVYPHQIGVQVFKELALISYVFNWDNSIQENPNHF